ncbi:hypothetical protein [Streptomyces sp. TRM68416]|uniref:hypothetical protein n=1 Tax=Streptomyces sp. TRM68416 TaxID=2758412 RepID=UPI001661E2BA|nr:hypothetical protein [Streptomyces sp. TRM68416]MBD0842093.1 hypothetical protein [Streptomyces sp. TRM68416]
MLGWFMVAAGFFPVLFAGDLSGLWPALIGWFLIATAPREARQAELRGALADLPVRRGTDGLLREGAWDSHRRTADADHSQPCPGARLREDHPEARTGPAPANRSRTCRPPGEP